MSEKELKIDEKRLKQIIREEMIKKLSEDVDHEGAAAVTQCASKLLKAIGDFREKATESANSALNQGLTAVLSTLENMINAPSSYVDAPKKVPQRVSFKAGSSKADKLL